VPRVIVRVCVASTDKVVNDSKNGKARFEPRNRWSHAHNDDNPSSSARVA
jgi:hypothetical protein